MKEDMKEEMEPRCPAAEQGTFNTQLLITHTR